MNKGFVRKVITGALIACMCITGVFSYGTDPVSAKSKAKLNYKSITIAKGGKKVIRLKNGKGKWSIKKGGIVKVCKKTKNYITIKPVKAGRTVVVCKTGGKTLKCKVRVLNNKVGKPKDDHLLTTIVGKTETYRYTVPDNVTLRGINYNEKKAKINCKIKKEKGSDDSYVILKINPLKPGRSTLTVYYLEDGVKNTYEEFPLVSIKGFRGETNVKKTETNYKKWRKKVISSMASKNMTTWEMIHAIGNLISTGSYGMKGGATGIQLWYGGNGTCVSGAQMMNDFMKDIGVNSKVHFAGNSGMNIDIYGCGITYASQHKNTWIKLGGKKYELNPQPEMMWPMGIIKL